MAGRGRDRVLPAWMVANGAPAPPGPPSMSSNNWADVDQIATAAVLQEQDAELRATLAQQRSASAPVLVTLFDFSFPDRKIPEAEK